MLRNFVCSFLAGAGMFGAVYLVERGVSYAGAHGDTTFLDDWLLGVFAAVALLYLLRRRECVRRQRRRQVAAVTNELNHHIRNAMQVIVDQSELDSHGADGILHTRIAIGRIDWALRVVLPRVNQPARSRHRFAFLRGILRAHERCVSRANPAPEAACRLKS